MFQFYWPWFALLLPLPLLIKWLLPQEHNGSSAQTPEIYFPTLDRLKKAYPSSSSIKYTSNRFFFPLLYVVWVLLVIALMQPEKINQWRQIKSEGYDLMLAVDLSASMQAIDFSTSSKVINRLDITKEVVGNFVKKRIGDRVGLITFGESAYLHVPLTLDTYSVSRMLNDTVTGMAGNSTAIGDAIGLSVRTLRERPEGSRVLILLTDGEDNASTVPPLEAAKLAKQYGIRIYTIGIGKNGSVPFPTPYGGYAMAEVPIDEKLLKEIATMTGGEYFRATDQQALESIYHQIDSIEKTESSEKNMFVRDPLFIYPLSFAALLFFILSFSSLLNRRAVYGS